MHNTQRQDDRGGARDDDHADRGVTPEFMRFLNIDEEGASTATTTATTATTATTTAPRLDLSFDNLEAMLDSLHRAENEFMDVATQLPPTLPPPLKPEFTPLLSPMIKNGTATTTTAAMTTTTTSTSSSATASTRFSPLSSPLLEFHRYQDTGTLRKRVDTEELSPNSNSNTNTNNTNNKKPRTPSTTPLMPPRRPSSALALADDDMALSLPLSLPQHISRKHSYRNNVLLNPHHHKSATSSPVILPSSMPPPPPPPVGTNILSQFDPQDKKTSHKLAEQGRRNRMNIAIQDLDSLIPEEWKKDISVPSKATTVELGCRYIRYLLDKTNNKQ